MCNIYSGQDPARYEVTSRSLRIDGHSTSIRLENAFWDVLERMADSEGRPVNDLIAALWHEAVAIRDARMNFASVLRSSCLIFLEASDRDEDGDEATAAAA